MADHVIRPALGFYKVEGPGDLSCYPQMKYRKSSLIDWLIGLIVSWNVFRTTVSNMDEWSDVSGHINTWTGSKCDAGIPQISRTFPGRLIWVQVKFKSEFPSQDLQLQSLCQ